MPVPGSMTAQAMLCDYADSISGKLFICGGILTEVQSSVQSPHRVHFALAVTVRVPWGATNAEHLLNVELISESTQVERVSINYRPQDHLPEEERGMVRISFNIARPAETIPGSDVLVPIVLPLYGLALPRLGTYFFSVRIDDEELDRVSFRVAAPATITDGP